MANATGSSEHISLGPGRLLVAPLGTTEPTDLTTAFDAAWVEIGYTDEGSEFSYEYSNEPVPVAEEFDPLFYRTTERSGSVSFAMAENTARNLTVAFNGGTVTDDTTHITYEPPEPGNEVRKMLAFESEDGEERWVWRQCFQGGSVSLARRKGADKTTLPVEMRIEKPSAGGAPFKVLLANSRNGGAV